MILAVLRYPIFVLAVKDYPFCCLVLLPEPLIVTSVDVVLFGFLLAGRHWAQCCINLEE